MPHEVRAEMVANVWKIVVAEGDTIADGDTLVILESMKMEIPVLAESDGHGSPRCTSPRGTSSRRATSSRSSSSARQRLKVRRPDAPETSHVSGSEPLSVVPFLRALGEVGGSDLHCKVGSPPRVRIDGRLRKLQAPNLTPADTEHMVGEVLREDLVEEFAARNEADFAYSVPGLGRFRVNAFRSRGSAGLVFRRVSVGAIPLDDLGLPPVLSALAMEPRGLVLVTGPTGSGKTTTLAGHDRPHQQQPRGPHRHDRGPDRGPALRQALDDQPARGPARHRRLRHRAARARCARTPTSSWSARCATTRPSRPRSRPPRPVTSSCRRCTPPTRRRPSPASSTSSRRTSRSRSGSRWPARCAASSASAWCPAPTARAAASTMEVCVNTGRIADAIADPDKTGTISELIKEGAYYGMQTFDQHLVALIRDGVITLDAAMAASTSPHDLTVELRRLGLVA